VPHSFLGHRELNTIIAQQIARGTWKPRAYVGVSAQSPIRQSIMAAEVNIREAAPEAAPHETCASQVRRLAYEARIPVC
jgi:hypothetical protein